MSRLYAGGRLYAGSWLHAGREVPGPSAQIRCRLVVLLLAAVLLWPEPQAAGWETTGNSVNKVFWCSQASVVHVAVHASPNHHGGEWEEERSGAVCSGVGLCRGRCRVKTSATSAALCLASEFNSRRAASMDADDASLVQPPTLEALQWSQGGDSLPLHPKWFRPRRCRGWPALASGQWTWRCWT